MGRERQATTLRFPVGGVNVVSARHAQPEGTCVNCLNVRAFDNLEERARGGIRPGLTKYLANTFEGSGRIQDINFVTLVRDAAPSATSLYVRETKAVAVSNGTIQQFNTTEVVPAQSSGTAVLAANSAFIMSAELYGNIYYSDGRNYKEWVGYTGADEVQSMAASTATGGTYTLTLVHPPGNSGATTTTAAIAFDASAATIETAIDTAMVAIVIDGVTWSAGDISVSGGPTDSAPVVFTYDGASASNRNWGLMTVDGGSLTGGAAGAVTTTTPGKGNIAQDWTLTAGSLPGSPGNGAGNSSCRLMETWDGRIVMAGLRTDPNNWFMSSKGDPDDFDYAPANTTAIQAVTGAVGVVGKMDDVINCMIPYSEDILIFGCDHSIWQMSGNPMEGGRIDNVSQNIGMPFGRPWCRDPDGNVYFFSNRGDVYKMPPYGAKPAPISDAIHPLMKTVNLNTHFIRMEWDDDADGCQVWITPLGNTAVSTHYFFDTRTNGWFPIKYGSTNYNPIAVKLFDGDAPTDRVVLLGGEDGKIRYVNPTVVTDDGTVIPATVTLGPIASGDGSKVLINHIKARTDPDGSDTKYEILVGDTPELAQETEAGTFIGEATFAAGLSLTSNPMKSGYYGYLKVGSNAAITSWGLEDVSIDVEITTTDPGRIRVT